MNKDWYGKTASVNSAFSVEGLHELSQKLDNMLAKNPAMEKKIQKVIGKFLSEARKYASKEVQSVLDNDPRKAYKAVRRTVYRSILGGNLNILRKKRAGAAGTYEKPRTLRPGQRGGNRMKRSERTQRLEGYEGDDRGFILRFFEGGARKGGGNRRLRSFRRDNHRAQVKKGSQGGDTNKYGKTVNTGYRGHIGASNFFGQIANDAFNRSMYQLEQLIDDLLSEEFNK